MKLLTLLQLVRAPAGFTAVSNILAAAIIASYATLSVELLYLVFASVCLYFSGMALNDCFDYQEDLAERANRPIPSNKLSLTQAWFVGFSLMATGIALAFSFSATSGYISIALSAAILLYNGLIKEGFLGSCCMASCRYLNWLLGLSFVGLTSELWLFALPIFFYITGLTFLSKQETHGDNKSAVYLCAIMIFFTALSSIYLSQVHFQLHSMEMLIAVILIALWLILMAKKLIAVFQNFVPENIQKLIGFMVIGVIPLDAVLVAMSGEYLWSLVILALLPPCRMLNKYLYVT